MEALPKNIADPYSAKLDDQIIEAGRIGARHEHDDAMETVALLHIFVVIELLEKLPNLGDTVFEVFTPAKVDEQQVHVGGPKRIGGA
jgi:hypothetical protein